MVASSLDGGKFGIPTNREKGQKMQSMRLKRSTILVAFAAVVTAGVVSASADANVGQPGWITNYSFALDPATDPDLDSASTVGVNVANGNLFYQTVARHQDNAIEDPGYMLYYNSQLGATKSGLGDGWTFSIGPDISFVDGPLGPSGSVPPRTLHGPSGYTVQLEPSPVQGPNGREWIGPPGFNATMGCLDSIPLHDTCDPRGGLDTSILRSPSPPLIRHNASPPGPEASYYRMYQNDPRFYLAFSGAIFNRPAWTRPSSTRVSGSLIAGQMRLTSYNYGLINFGYDANGQLQRTRQSGTVQWDPVDVLYPYNDDYYGGMGHYSSDYYENDSRQRPMFIRGRTADARITYDASNRVHSLTVTPKADRFSLSYSGPSKTVTFDYSTAGANRTIVTTADGSGIQYTYADDDRVTSTQAVGTGDGAFSCQPDDATPPPPDLPTSPGSDQSSDPAQSDPCPVGSSSRSDGPEPTGFGWPEIDPAATTSMASPQAAAQSNVRPSSDGNYRWYAGFYRFFDPNINTVEDPSPTRGVSATITISRPSTQDQKSAHSVGQLALSRTLDNSSVVEVGWNTNPSYYRDTNPHLFATWTRGKVQHFNGCSHVKGGARSGDTLTPTSSASGRDFAIIHDDDHNRWYLYYRGKAFCSYPDSQWDNTFQSAHSVQWFGEVADANTEPGSDMGDGLKACNPDAARFLNATNVGGRPSGPAQQLTGNDDDVFYTEQRLTDTGFRFGGKRSC